MRCKTTSKCFSIAVVILAASPALAHPAGRDVYRGAFDQKPAPERTAKPGACLPGKTCAFGRIGPNAAPDDWQSRMILG
jgi:hypothetical protein